MSNFTPKTLHNSLHSLPIYPYYLLSLSLLWIELSLSSIACSFSHIQHVAIWIFYLFNSSSSHNMDIHNIYQYKNQHQIVVDKLRENFLLLFLLPPFDKSQMNHCQIEVKEESFVVDGDVWFWNGWYGVKKIEIKARKCCKLYPQIECLHVCIGYILSSIRAYINNIMNDWNWTSENSEWDNSSKINPFNLWWMGWKKYLLVFI